MMNDIGLWLFALGMLGVCVGMVGLVIDRGWLTGLGVFGGGGVMFVGIAFGLLAMIFDPPPCPDDVTMIRHFLGYHMMLVGKVMQEVPQYAYECVKP